jgi:hypothetical protein
MNQSPSAKKTDNNQKHPKQQTKQFSLSKQQPTLEYLINLQQYLLFFEKNIKQQIF